METITPEKQLENVANLLLALTTPTHQNTRRPDSYPASKEEIADTGRQLAEMILAYLKGELDATTDELPF